MKHLEWRNHKRFQLLAALAVVALLFGVFMQRVTHLSAESERVAADQSVVTMTTLLTQVVVKHAVLGKLNELQVFADTNPMRLVEAQLGVVPANYAGEMHRAQAAQVSHGKWFFDLDSRELVYRYISRPEQLRLRLAVNFSNSDANDILDPGKDRITGLHLKRSTVEVGFPRHDKVSEVKS